MSDHVQIERTFDAPVATVWEMWTDPGHFAAWYGPMGAEVTVATMDVEVGGTRHICMTMSTPDGPMQMWFVGTFTEITENERLVYTDSMSDADGNVLSPAQMGMPEGHPQTTEVIVELTPVDGRTRMVMTHVGVPADSPGAGGWAMAFDKLADHLAA